MLGGREFDAVWALNSKDPIKVWDFWNISKSIIINDPGLIISIKRVY